MWLRYFSVLGAPVFGIAVLGVPIVLVTGLLASLGMLEPKNGINFIFLVMLVSSVYGLKGAVDTYRLIEEPKKGLIPELYSAVRNAFDLLIYRGGTEVRIWKLLVLFGPFFLGIAMSLLMVVMQVWVLLVLVDKFDVPQLVVISIVSILYGCLSVLLAMVNWRVYRKTFKSK